MANNLERLVKNKPPLFSPSVVKHIRDGSNAQAIFKKTNGSAYEDTSMGLSSSFKYNANGVGLRSTQQLNIDWSVFENHTFFNSAQVKTNVAFDKIVNSFPFDGRRKEVELFFDKLTGFEKYIYDEMPHQRGYLFFSGSASSETDGSYITVKDYVGAQYPSISTKTGGETVLDPGLSSMTIEMHVYIPNQSLGSLNQTILHKTNAAGTQGYGIVVETGASPTTASVSMIVAAASGTLEDKVTLPVALGEWNHVAWTWDRTPGVDSITGFLNTLVEASSSTPFEAGYLGTGGNDLYVGSGSVLGTFTPDTTFSGALDEIRIWHDVRTTDELKEHQQKLVWPDDDLKLYYKLNEPSGSNTNIVLDYSGNSLHGKFSPRGITLGTRDIATGSLVGVSPMTYEALSLSPVLFPNVEGNVDLRADLLASASLYDTENPNLITKLVPPHYLDEGQSFSGFSNPEGDIIEANENGDNPGGNNLGDTQALLSLMYTWAKFFDEMKLYIQAFSSLKHLNYDSEDTIPADFLSVYAEIEGIELPPLFVGSSIEQFIEGQNLDDQVSKNVLGVQQIQNEIWKRILINMRDVIKSKGTIHSIKAYMRSVGINPDNNFRIREYGGPTKNSMEFAREKRFESTTMLNFVSGGFITSEALSSSVDRVEVGLPTAGPSSTNNRILTSGSFTAEASYRFLRTIEYEPSQSLARMKITGSAINSIGTMTMNLVAVTGSADAVPRVTLYANANSGSADFLELSMTGADLFDGDLWYASFGRFRQDDLEIDSVASASYFLRLAKNKNGVIVESYVTASHLFDDPITNVFSNNIISTGSLTYDGPYLQIGSSSLDSPAGAGTVFLEQTATPATAKTVNFEGRATQIRFWSKGLNDLEWKEHVRNYSSVGVQDPKTNFNFVDQNVSGAWERLRLDASTDQIELAADSSGLIDLTDFSQNDLGMSGSGFTASSTVIVPEHVYFSYLSPKVDEGVSSKKIRSRSFQNADKVADSPWAELAPTYRVNPFLEVTDSTKLTIDFSIIDSLDQDIITIFSSLDEINNAIGNPELQFASSYHDLEVMREVYFNKLEGKMNLKGFFAFYKWFDTNVGTFVEQLVPKKTKFLGTNFVIESHFLERSKVQYRFEDVYLGEDIRSGLKDKLLFQLITGKLDRF